ncbi:MAG: tautomerase family protein [Symbiobacterium sp.]|uniref:4-oxalocrotonate tautomerase family protein n=1 Tax=Symbiobacterium sp. TaxID=1971213 RepID=UPI003463895E
MPFITVDHLAGVDPEVRRRLQERVAQTVVDTLGVPPQNVRVFTRAFAPEDVYRGDGDVTGALPMVRVEFMTGRSLELKRKLMVALARVVAETLGADAANVRTIIYENEPHHFCFGETPR